MIEITSPQDATGPSSTMRRLTSSGKMRGVAVLLGGSSGRGDADDWSDHDIQVFHGAPTTAARDRGRAIR
jgi:hypothetical protein